MMSPAQLRARARFETLIGAMAPVLDLVLAAGDRVSKVVGADDDYIPIRAGSDRPALGRSGARISAPEAD